MTTLFEPSSQREQTLRQRIQSGTTTSTTPCAWKFPQWLQHSQDFTISVFLSQWEHCKSVYYTDKIINKLSLSTHQLANVGKHMCFRPPKHLSFQPIQVLTWQPSVWAFWEPFCLSEYDLDILYNTTYWRILLAVKRKQNIYLTTKFYESDRDLLYINLTQ